MVIWIKALVQWWTMVNMRLESDDHRYSPMPKWWLAWFVWLIWIPMTMAAKSGKGQQRSLIFETILRVKRGNLSRGNLQAKLLLDQNWDKARHYARHYDIIILCLFFGSQMFWWLDNQIVVAEPRFFGFGMGHFTLQNWRSVLLHSVGVVENCTLRTKIVTNRFWSDYFQAKPVRLCAISMIKSCHAYYRSLFGGLEHFSIIYGIFLPID